MDALDYTNITKYAVDVELQGAFRDRKDSMEIISFMARSKVHSASGYYVVERILRNVNNGFESPAISV